jgi:hypothetical protein
MVVAGSSLTNGDRDELAEWLVQPPVLTEDPLRWWIANQKLYPRLARMAIDVYMAPGKFFLIITFIILTTLPSNGCGC